MPDHAIDLVSPPDRDRAPSRARARARSRRTSFGEPLLVGALLLGSACRQDAKSPAKVPPLPPPAPEVTRQLSLELSAQARVGLGDDLALRITARNDAEAPVTVVRPMYGSWEGAREPTYALEWTDEHGASIPDPLGFAPGIDCGTLDRVDDDDRIAVAPGSSADLPGAPDARARHEVLPSARPGRYSLRVHYTALAVGGATPLELRSAAVPVEITEGDAALWKCRADQLTQQRDHEYAEPSWGNFVATSDGTRWLVTGRYVHRVEAGTANPYGEIWARPFDAQLRPLAEAIRVVQSETEIGWVSAAAVGDTVVVVASPGAVGGRRIEAYALDLSGPTPTAGDPVVLQPAPGNPYVTRVLTVGDHVLVFHEGDEEHDDTLMVTRIDARARPVEAAHPLARDFHGFEVAIGPQGPMIGWLQRGTSEGAAIQTLDAEGRALGAPIRVDLDPSHSLLALTSTPHGIDLAYADRSTRGDDPSDQMGVYMRSYGSDGAARGPAQALGPESKWSSAFGDVAWSGDRIGRLVMEEHRLSGGPATGRPTLLSETAYGDPHLWGDADGFWALWSDTRDDKSDACLRLKDCTPEKYAAVLEPDGSVRAGPVRVTTQAMPRPFVPPDHEWVAHCRDRRRSRTSK